MAKIRHQRIPYIWITKNFPFIKLKRTFNGIKKKKENHEGFSIKKLQISRKSGTKKRKWDFMHMHFCRAKILFFVHWPYHCRKLHSIVKFIVDGSINKLDLTVSSPFSAHTICGFDDLGMCVHAFLMANKPQTNTNILMLSVRNANKFE